MNILLVFCHPRRRSLTGAIADAFAEGAAAAGHEVEFVDLYAEGFDPRLHEEDEPDWDHQDKRYSDAVRAEMQRVDRNDAIVLIFPVWWWSMPAILKGWIDRVWNLGFAYGSKTLTQTHGLAIGVAASSAQGFAKRGYDQAFSTQITTGIMDYCGIDHASSEILHESTSDDDTRRVLLERARKLGEAFPSK